MRSAVESVLSQTMPDWELLFWDNHSSDDSAAIVKSYDDDRILYHLAPEHTDLGEARRQACRHAAGEWIGVLDCDDLWMPEKLEQQLKAVVGKQHVGLIYSRSEEFSENTSRIVPPFEAPLPQGNIFSSLMRGNFICMPSLMYRRIVLEDLGGFKDYKYAEEYELSLRVARQYHAVGIDEVHCRYRVHENNASHKLTELGLQESLQILSQFLPDPAAVDGMRQVRANYACWALRQRKILCALQQLIKGGMSTFCRMSWDRLMRVKQS